MYNLKIAFRNPRRNGIYSIINIIGLTISLTACILITLWVQNELSFDKIHKKGDRIYRIVSQLSSQTAIWSVSPAPLGIYAKEDIVGVENYCRTSNYLPEGYISYEDKKFYDLSMLAVDSSFFEIFDFRMLEGEKKTPFPDSYSAIISKSKSGMLFGDENPIGKSLKSSYGITLHVSGIIDDIPDNSSIQADILIPFQLLNVIYNDGITLDDNWGKYDYATYLVLSQQASIDDISGKLADKLNDLSKKYGGSGEITTSLQPLYQMHLYSLSGEPRGMRSIYIFSGIAILILIVSCINYVNLVTARANKRGDEIAIKKIMGAEKRTLFVQLIAEMVILAIISLLTATLLIYLVMPFYNELCGKELTLNFFSFSTLSIYVLTLLITVRLAGLYPALTLIGFKPTYAFQPRGLARNKALFRKVLIVLQFAFSVGLVMVTIVLTTQVRYMRKANLGYDKENMLVVNLMNTTYHTVKDRLSAFPEIIDMTAAAYGHRGSTAFQGIRKKTTGEAANFMTYFVDTSYFSTMKIPFIEGRGFTSDMSEESLKLSAIVNEAGAKVLGQGESVVGTRVDKGYADIFEIVGVVKDYSYESLHSEIKPLILFYHPLMLRHLYIKTLPDNAEKLVTEVEKMWKEYNPDYNFSYRFLDDDFDMVYKSELRTNLLFTIFSLIAILISCLGLFGLITFSTEAKAKEIGIRKALGASVRSIVSILTKDFLFLLGVAVVVVLPITYYLLERVLQNYAYRIDITWRMFVLAMLIVVVVTLLTVGGKAIIAARANPVKAMKAE
ncbi:MAG: ABC transporter permease [Prevotellaceae bacterium]|jgi:ABC-type antimicrobial peptide transport system permease subunit|nr:ABC transporter permease [Prevotellaceae bacterium]